MCWHFTYLDQQVAVKTVYKIYVYRLLSSIVKYSFAAGVAGRVETLEDMSQRLAEFQDSLGDVNSALQRLEDRLDSHQHLGAAARDPKYTDMIKVYVLLPKS